ncbi:MAG: protein kinase [Ktedonobacterales bacterium]
MQPSPPPPYAVVAVAQPPPLAPGTLLGGRYRIAGHVGGGGFAHIYDAHDTVLGHRRAIKEAFARDPNTRWQFQLEAEFVLNARHPNLVRGYAVFEQGGRFYLVMDYVDGLTLEELAIRHIHASGQPVGEAQILDWIVPVCDAAHELHQQPTPIIHRDIKPANIKLNGQGTPLLIDLGLAKLYANGTQTIGAALAFTPGYAPPEQYQASGATDQRTDVYALGATLYFLLTGYQPTEAPARLAAHALPPPRALNPAVSAATEAALLRAMALDPAARQQSAAELTAELRQARAQLAGRAGTTAPEELLARPAGVRCASCDAPNPLEARHCSRCGQPIARLPYGPREPHGARALTGMPAVRLPAPLGALRALPAALSRALAARPLAEPGEAQAAIAAVLALVLFSLSVLAVFSGWALLLVVPALGCAAFSFTRQSVKSPPELRVLTVLTMLLSIGWALAWLLAHRR